MRVQQTRVYLAKKYGICRQTVSKLFAERCGITHQGILTPMDLEIWITKIGTPEQFRRQQEILKD